MEIEFPIEFIVHGTPVSLQAARAESREQWKARVRNASASVLPTPDVIALREDRNLAIEVTNFSSERDIRLRDIAALFSGQDNWEFRIIWAGPGQQPETLPKQPMSEIASKLAEIDRLVEGGHTDAAFLLSWAVLEALGRTLFEEMLRRPQTPGRLVEVLAAEGVLSPSEADIVRSLIPRHNQLVHGGLDAGVSVEDALALRTILHTIIDTTVH